MTDTDTFPFADLIDPATGYEIDINPPSIYARYTAITGILTTFWSADKIDSLLEDYEEWQLIDALKRAKNQGKTSWPYIEAVLRNEHGRKVQEQHAQAAAIDLFLAGD